MTPADENGHGTHVAGIAAGNRGTEGRSGVAPAAVLGNYNIFPGGTESASSDDIAVAVEEAVRAGMDVLKLSLGGTPTPEFDPLDIALLEATKVGVVPVVAAGNTGPGAGTIEAPGWAPWVITVGSSTNAHFEGQSPPRSATQRTPGPLEW